MKPSVRKSYAELTKHEVKQFLECISFIQAFECPVYLAKSIWENARNKEINEMSPENYMEWTKQKKIRKVRPKTKKEFKQLNYKNRIEVVDFLREFYKNNEDS